jgi:integrase
MFKWAVAEELLPPTIHAALQCVHGLKAGRTEAKESEPVTPVSTELVHRVKADVSPSIAGLIDFQLLTGARPGEAVALRLCAINVANSIWEYVPASHKTQHHDKDRRVMIGPKCQELIRQRMINDTTAPLFPSRFGSAYTVHGYRTAIRRACKRLGVPNWSPNQLRHTAATAIRSEAGIETTRVVLGHASAVTSEIYAEKDYAAARSIMARIG